jgi:DNA repair protein RadD
LERRWQAGAEKACHLRKFMVQLRDYQEAAVQAVRDSFRAGHKRTLLVSPTGSGKTVIFSYIAAGMARNNKRILIVAHRRELLKQISAALKKVGVSHAVLSGGTMGIPTANVVVASVFTLVRRMKMMKPFDLIIGDEAHHFTPQSSWGKVVEGFPTARVLGVTATPERLDGKGMGQMFDDMVMGPTVSELTAQGFLSHALVYAPSAPDLGGVGTRMGDYVSKQLEEAMDKSVITGSAVKHYGKHAPGKRAIAFCVSVKHAKDVAQDFRESGYAASHIDGGMDDTERDGVLAKFETGEIQVLTSCDLVSEGFDFPLSRLPSCCAPRSLWAYTFSSADARSGRTLIRSARSFWITLAIPHGMALSTTIETGRWLTGSFWGAAPRWKRCRRCAPARIALRFTSQRRPARCASTPILSWRAL